MNGLSREKLKELLLYGNSVIKYSDTVSVRRYIMPEDSAYTYSYQVIDDGDTYTYPTAELVCRHIFGE